jgi:shikimate dehydrogenase
MFHNFIRAAVLGSPIAHSLSPVLHNAAYRTLGIDGEYLKFEVEEFELEEFLEQHEDFNGFSLTMPLKDQAFKISVSRDAAAEVTQACNTLLKSPLGWVGANTDVPGFVNSFKRVGVTHLSDVLIVGAGATARSAIAAMDLMQTESIRVMARKQSAMNDLVHCFPHMNIECVEWSTELPASTCVISTVPAGVADNLILNSATSVLFDVIYAPWPTSLALTAEEHDVLVLGGLELLVAQAVEQFLLMTDCDKSLAGEIYTSMYEAGLREQALRSSQAH